MSGIGGTQCQKLIKSFKAAGMEVREINDHEFWCDGYRYIFDKTGENQIGFVRETSGKRK